MTVLKVEIDANQAKLDNVETRSGTKNGKDWSMRSQMIWVYEQGAKFPLKIQHILPDGVPVYPEGEYTIDYNHAFAQGNFNSHGIDTRKLQLVPFMPSRSSTK